MKAIPTVEKYMSVLPHTIGSGQSLERAKEMMSLHQIRHLPVLEGGKLVGLLSDRDVNFALSFRDVDAKVTKVDELYAELPYCTAPDAKLDEVVEYMAEHKFGSALVVANGKLVGIFTAVDAMHALSDLLKTRLQH